MKINGYINQRSVCPPYSGRAVCVDVTPLRRQDRPEGERQVFKLVFELGLERSDGRRQTVWSDNFMPKLTESSCFGRFLRGWLGRDLTEEELDEFDTESLIGKPAQVVVVRECRDNGVFASLVSCKPEPGTPLELSGKYVRLTDRCRSERAVTENNGRPEASRWKFGSRTLKALRVAFSPRKDRWGVKLEKLIGQVRREPWRD